VKKIMSSTHANGIAVAVVDHGKVGFVQTYGIRNAKGDQLTTDTVMSGASVTKTVFATPRCSWSIKANSNLTRPSRTISTIPADLWPRPGLP
jgi:hypothetical protein